MALPNLHGDRLGALPVVKIPTSPRKPLSQLVPFHPWRTALDQGFIDQESKEIAPAIMQALIRFAGTFVFNHSGAYERKPNPMTREHLKKWLKSGAKGPVWQVRYHELNLGKPGNCTMRRCLSGAYYTTMRRQGYMPSSLLHHERVRVDQLHPYRLEWRALLQHLLGWRQNALQTRFMHLETGRRQWMRYFVLDLDDHAAQATTHPREPSPRISSLLDTLTTCGPLHPKNAMIFTSPSGRGRHLHYFLSKPMRSGPLSELVAGFLRWSSLNLPAGTRSKDKPSGIAHLDIKPDPTDRSTMTPLPLCRGSFLCDQHGVPVPPVTVRELLLHLDARLSAPDLPMLDPAELELAPEQAVSVATPLKLHDLLPDPVDDSGAPATAEELLQNGLTAPQQRWRACNVVAAHLRGLGHDENEVLQQVRQFMIEKNNGKSTDYNDDPEQVLKDLGGLVSRLFKFWSQTLLIRKADVRAVIEAILKKHDAGTLKLDPPGAQTSHFLVWTCNLVALMKGLPKHVDLKKGFITAKVASRLLKNLPFGTNGAYAKHLRRLSSAKLVERTSDADTGTSRGYRINIAVGASRAGGQPVDAVLVDVLEQKPAWRNRFFLRNAWERMCEGSTPAPSPIVVKK